MTTEGVIYKIVDKTTKKIYIGSCVDFKTRKLTHENSFKKKRNDTTSYLVLQNNDYEYEIIEKIFFNDIKELRTVEKYHILQNKNICVNKCTPIRTEEDKKNYVKQWREDNKEMISERQKIYNDGRKEEKKEYDRLYNMNNKENRRGNGKKYREANKEKMNSKIKCVCGVEYKFMNKWKHEQSKHHKKYLNN